jgi:hypothetical protein
LTIGVTLSDEEAQQERAQSRLLARWCRSAGWPSKAHRTGDLRHLLELRSATQLVKREGVDDAGRDSSLPVLRWSL